MRAAHGPDGVDGLDLIGGETTRGPSQQSAFDPQDPVFDPPARDQPGNETERAGGHDHPDLDQDGGVVAVTARPGDGQDDQPAERSAGPNQGERG